MEEFTHVKINVGENQSFIVKSTSVESVKEKVEFLRESCINPTQYDRILANIEKGNYEYINMSNKPAKRKRLKKETKNLQS